MANGHDRERLDLADDKTVKKFASKLTCTFDELVRALSSYSSDRPFVSLEAGESNEDPLNSLAKLSAMASSMFGGNPEVWEYQVSIQYVRQMIDSYIRIQLHQGNSETKGKDGLRKLAKYVDEIRKSNAQL